MPADRWRQDQAPPWPLATDGIRRLERAKWQADGKAEGHSAKIRLVRNDLSLLRPALTHIGFVSQSFSSVVLAVRLDINRYW